MTRNTELLSIEKVRGLLNDYDAAVVAKKESGGWPNWAYTEAVNAMGVAWWALDRCGPLEIARLAAAQAEELTRLREALEWYAEPSIYQQEHFEGTGMEYPALVDGGHSARLALSAAEAPAGGDG